jgi:hypothetical protein
MTHDACRETLALHALGASEAAERQALESHLETCPSCAAELAELRETAARLTLLAAPVTPAAGGVERLLALIDGGEDAAVGDAPAASPPRPGRARRWRPLVLVGRVAVAAGIVVLGVSQLRLLGRLDQAYREIRRMREIAAFVTSPDVTVVSLSGGSTTQGAHAKLVYDRRTGRFMLLSPDLAPPPEGRRYQLWVLSEGIRPAAALSLDSLDGVLRAQPGADPFLFAVSLEPTAEVDEPTGRLVLMSGLMRDPR